MEWLRDVVIVITGFLTIILLIIFAVLGLVLYSKAKMLTSKARDIITRSEKASSSRLSQATLIIQGLATILNAIANLKQERR